MLSRVLELPGFSAAEIAQEVSMTLALRMMVTAFRSLFRPRLRMTDSVRTAFRVWPWEAEWRYASHVSLVMLLQLGRQDFIQRAGFLRVAVSNHWFTPVASACIRYRRPIRRFEKIVIETRFPYWDRKWLFAEQTIFQGERAAVTAIFKCAIKGGDRIVRPDLLLRQLWQAQPDLGWADIATQYLRSEMVGQNPSKTLRNGADFNENETPNEYPRTN